MNDIDLIKWIWAYSEQLYLFDKNDAFWIECAKSGWKGHDGEKEFNRFLTAYGLKRGIVGHNLKDEQIRRKILNMCNGEFTRELSDDHYMDAQDRWINVIEKTQKLIGATAASATLKIFWFYHPEKLPMYDQYVRKALSEKLKMRIDPYNFLINFANFMTTEANSKIQKAEKSFSRKYLSFPRIADKYLWLCGSNRGESIIEKFESGRRKIPY